MSLAELSAEARCVNPKPEGFLTLDHRLRAPSQSVTLQWYPARRLPVNSDRIVQDSHLIPLTDLTLFYDVCLSPYIVILACSDTYRQHCFPISGNLKKHEKTQKMPSALFRYIET